MANTEKTAAELLQENLLMHPENAGILLSDEELEEYIRQMEEMEEDED